MHMPSFASRTAANLSDSLAAMVPTRRTMLLAGATVVGAAAVWSCVASTLFAYGTGIAPAHPIPLTEWWDYAFNAPRGHRAWPLVRRWLWLSGVAAAIPVASAAAKAMVSARRRARRLNPVKRATSDNHGHAEWMSMAEARELFPGPDPVHGGVVVGEAYRVDQDSVAHLRFDARTPEGRHTWGRGGTAPLLVDPCINGSTHSMILAGSAGYKSTTLTTTLTHRDGWRGGLVVMDPSCELGPTTRAAREALGHKVVELIPGGDAGFNVLDWIDTKAPLATTNVEAVAYWITGPTPAGTAEEAAKWKAWGRDMVTCLLAHMLWTDDATLPPEDKTLITLRELVATPSEEMRKLLQVVYETSNSGLARQLAGTLKDVVNETFSGIYQNATADTRWIANEAYAGLVAGNTFRTADLPRGKLSVYLQVPDKALKATPAIARVVIGSLLNAMFEADGAVNGRVLFALDEVALLGRMPELTTALTQGRKYRLSLHVFYQDDGQVEDVWGKPGKRTWYSNLSWRAYAAVSDIETAKEVSAACGEHGVVAASESRNRGWQAKLGEMGGTSSGASENKTEGKRELIKPGEILHDMRADEQIVLPRGAAPLRCGRAIWFRRKDMEGAVGANRFAPAAGRNGAGDTR